MATGRPIAVAFDSGNLLPVAEAIRSKYPNAAIIICADNDHSMQKDGKPYNIGVEKAQQVAKKINGTVRIPNFTAKERAKGLTDFNDLHKSRGIEAVQHQFSNSLTKEVER